VLAENGRPVLSIHVREKTVEVPNESQLSEDRLILLTVFTWHLVRQNAEDSAAVAVTVAATS